MAVTNPLDRLTASDLFMLWEDYGWSSDIGGIAMLDGTGLLDGDGHVRIEEIRLRLEPRLHLVPRFRQVLYRPRRGLGWPLWVDAPSFDVADHVRIQALGGDADEAQLLQACQEAMRRRLDPARPLWELLLLPGLPEQRVGALLRVHHAMADGAAGVAAFGALLDLNADAPRSAAPQWTPAPMPSTRELLDDNIRRRGEELARASLALMHPARTLRRARQTWPAWREVLSEKPAPKTSLNRPVGDDRLLMIVRARLDDVKRVAHTHNAKVNDVVLTAVAEGLRRLLVSRGEDVRGLEQRAMVPISLHQEAPGQAHGNKPGWMMVPLPLGEHDAQRRLQRIAAETAALKHKARPEAGTGIFRFVAGQRLWYRRFPAQRSVNLVVTDVPGPPMPLYLVGARVLEVFPLVSLMGNLTLVVAVLSYDGQLNLTAVADGDACPDVDVFVEGVRSALDELATDVLVPVS